MPRQSPGGAGIFTPPSLSPSYEQQHHPQPQPAYGLLEPHDSPTANRTITGVVPRRRDRAGSLGSPPPIALTARRHRRKPSSFGRSVGRVVPAWDDVEAGLDTLKDRGAEIGATIGALSDRLTDAVPGVRGSIVFLSILQSNIQLSAREGSASPFVPPISLPPPPPLQPLTEPTPPAPIMERDRLNADSQAAIGSAEAPELVYETPKDQDARIDGLRLIADSVAQMRQAAASVLIASPLFLMLVAAVPIISYYSLYHSASDYPIILTTTGGFTMAALVAVRWVLKGYIIEAERINWKWLDDDQMLVARFGKEIIGALVYHVAKSNDGNDITTTGAAGKSAKSRRKGDTKSNTGRSTAEIRAWTVRRRERGHGVGKALLEAAVKVCLKDHQCENVVFAGEQGDRAGSRRVLSPLLATVTGIEGFQLQNEERARDTLSKTVEQLQEK